MNAYHCPCYLVDIDGTITDYHPGALVSARLLGGNFLFPIFRDLMVEQGWNESEAEARILQLAERIVYWDYPDFIAEFNLPRDEAFRRMRAWHRECLLVYGETVELLRMLHRDGRQLYVMSNNPYVGCLLKLELAGLAQGDCAPIFAGIFGTNRLFGCKLDPDVWKRALAQLPFAPNEIGTIGDNPHEDEELPRSLGIGEVILVRRDNPAPPPGVVLGPDMARKVPPMSSSAGFSEENSVPDSAGGDTGGTKTVRLPRRILR